MSIYRGDHGDRREWQRRVGSKPNSVSIRVLCGEFALRREGAVFARIGNVNRRKGVFHVEQERVRNLARFHMEHLVLFAAARYLRSARMAADMQCERTKIWLTKPPHREPASVWVAALPAS